MKSRLRLIIAVIVGLITVVLNIFLVRSQEATPDIVITQDTLILRHNQLMDFDNATGQTIELLQLPFEVENISEVSALADNSRIFAAAVQAEMDTIYAIEHLGRDEQGFPTTTNFVKIDTQTGVINDRFSQSGMFSFTVSPREERVVVNFFEGRYGYSTLGACILDFVSRNCLPIELMVANTPVFWIDDRYFVMTTLDQDRIQLVDSQTALSEAIRIPSEWYIHSVVPIPGQNALLISARLQTDLTNPATLLRLDLASKELQPMSLQPPDLTNYPSVSRWVFSPNGNYLLYGGGPKMALADVNAGRNLLEFAFVVNAGWINDHTLLMQGSRDGVQLEIIRVDATTGVTTILAQGDAAGGILLIPDQ
jgi:hypothetical protein